MVSSVAFSSFEFKVKQKIKKKKRIYVFSKGIVWQGQIFILLANAT